MFRAVVESARLVVGRAEHVSINQQAVDRLAVLLKEKMADNEYDIRKWKADNALHPQTMDDNTVDWIFLIDSLNFSFWPNQDQMFTIEGEVGYWALCAAILRENRARETKGQPRLTDPNVYATISDAEALEIFKVDAPNDNVKTIPMLQERIDIMRQHGQILVEKFDGSFTNVVKQADGSALKLLSLVYEHFPSFRDEASYGHEKVTFLKRAQILVADVWACFEGDGWGRFEDIDQLTIFADYRIPQVLHYFDVLQYSDQLIDRLRKDDGLLENGEKMEVEIRAASIHAIELARQQMRQITAAGTSLPNSIQLDFFLWGFRRDHCEAIDVKSPYHRVRCIYY